MQQAVQPRTGSRYVLSATSWKAQEEGDSGLYPRGAELLGTHEGRGILVSQNSAGPCELAVQPHVSQVRGTHRPGKVGTYQQQCQSWGLGCASQLPCLPVPPHLKVCQVWGPRTLSLPLPCPGISAPKCSFVTEWNSYGVAFLQTPDIDWGWQSARPLEPGEGKWKQPCAEGLCAGAAPAPLCGALQRGDSWVPLPFCSGWFAGLVWRGGCHS